MRTFAGMFVRKRRNRSGTTSVVVVDKSSGRFKELTTIGEASTSEEIAALEAKAQRWIDHYGGQQTFDFEESAKDMEEIHRTISMIERTLTKDKVNKRGYNKFLDISKDIMVLINHDKIAEDARWNGLKGYVTDTDLDAKEVIRQYHGLWVVERAFRIGKSNLEMRPEFHFTPRRIEAHVCVCFVEYKVYKELERTLRVMGIGMSVDKVLFIAKTITTLKIRLPNGELYTETLYNTPQQEALKPLIEGVAHARE